jgi:ABC-type multidrug transport system fused ATPase/permease subunit
MMYSAAALGFNQLLGRLVREWTNLETSLAAISRVETFSETTASERDCGVSNTTPSLWPSGNIVLKNVSASYNGDEMPPGLNDISFEVSAGQEIGICERTGSGKSYLLLAMLRLMHLSSGSITIDGVIVEIPLQKLRSSITTVSGGTGWNPWNLIPFQLHLEYPTFQLQLSMETPWIVRAPWIVGVPWIVHGNPWILPHLDISISEKG